jgi:hypothetical protein
MHAFFRNPDRFSTYDTIPGQQTIYLIAADMQHNNLELYREYIAPKLNTNTASRSTGLMKKYHETA